MLASPLEFWRDKFALIKREYHLENKIIGLAFEIRLMYKKASLCDTKKEECLGKPGRYAARPGIVKILHGGLT